MKRTAQVSRKTLETEITAEINLDGTGTCAVSTGIGFFDHMITALSKHSRMDVTLNAKGDLHVDAHHTVEDTGYVLGEAFLKALGDKRGIRRFGYAYAPLDDSLARAVVDLSGRNYIVYDVGAEGMIGDFPAGLAGEFFRAFSNAAKINLHIQALYGRDAHHQIEAVFKACAVALCDAAMIIPGREDVPSTKGSL
jgi:imidazoleglycerol-phosphate dehydratase